MRLHIPTIRFRWRYADEVQSDIRLRRFRIPAQWFVGVGRGQEARRTDGGAAPSRQRRLREIGRPTPVHQSENEADCAYVLNAGIYSRNRSEEIQHTAPHPVFIWIAPRRSAGDER